MWCLLLLLLGLPPCAAAASQWNQSCCSRPPTNGLYPSCPTVPVSPCPLVPLLVPLSPLSGFVELKTLSLGLGPRCASAESLNAWLHRLTFWRGSDAAQVDDDDVHNDNVDHHLDASDEESIVVATKKSKKSWGGSDNCWGRSFSLRDTKGVCCKCNTESVMLLYRKNKKQLQKQELLVVVVVAVEVEVAVAALKLKLKLFFPLPRFWVLRQAACRLKCHRILLPAALQLSKGFCHLSLPQDEADAEAVEDGEKWRCTTQGPAKG